MTPPAATPAATTTTASPEATTPAASPLDAGWTPYTPDATKDAATNLQLKEAHDAKVPPGHDPNVKVEPKAAAPAAAPAPAAPAATPAPLMLTDLVAPEGYNIDPAMGTELLTTLNQFAGDPKALANELIKLQVKALGADDEGRSRAWDETQTAWKKQSEADPEIGGANYAKNTALATEIGARFGGPKLQEVLDLTGMGNHPEWLRFVSKLAPFVNEGGPALPGSATATKPGFSSTNLYPEQGKK